MPSMAVTRVCRRGHTCYQDRTAQDKGEGEGEGGLVTYDKREGGQERRRTREGDDKGGGEGGGR